ncbi:hypothetical protein C8Q79DRAFT_974458 [Trametes meyenii]|nr:hypothetical protein C8Q79DRAFT_974458 [Trametes meyenii]
MRAQSFDRWTAGLFIWRFTVLGLTPSQPQSDRRKYSTRNCVPRLLRRRNHVPWSPVPESWIIGRCDKGEDRAWHEKRCRMIHSDSILYHLASASAYSQLD